MRRLILIVLSCVASFLSLVCLSTSNPDGQASAQEIGFIEQFALSEDRDKTLQKLVPGTQDYYYFHCLHYLNKEQFDKVDEMLKPWIKRHGHSRTVLQIQNQLALLRYNDDPNVALAHLKRVLNLRFTHQREIPQTQRDLPTQLNQDLISTQRLLKDALARYSNTDGIETVALDVLAGQTLNKNQLRHLLQRLRYPDFPNLVNLIDRDMRERDRVNFGSYEIHLRMTLEQLQQLASKQTRMLDNNNFVNTYLTKLHPSNDIDWRADDAEYEKYLNRLWDFVKDLSPKFNSLKACVLYRQLHLDQKLNKHNKQRFLEYIKLPRQVVYINPTMLKQLSKPEHIVNLGANYQQQILLAPIYNDEPLVRAYLQKFLRDSNDESVYRPYIETNYLRRQFATTKILAGLGDNEKWATMLSPDEYKRLTNRIDLEFNSNNTEFFRLDQGVKLSLQTKNIDKLIVKVFEINTFNYYKKYAREIDTDVSLDGLVPNWEQTYSYSEPPALQVQREFEFDQIDKRGVYVIDFIGGGKSCRALVRKGRWSFFTRTNVAGQQFTILNDAGKVVKNASLWIAGRKYEANEHGKIQIPFSNSPGRESAIVTADGFSCLQTFDHQQETYQLRAAMYVDRQSLLRSNKAQLLIRPSLLIAGNPAPLKLLKNTRLVITTQNLDGLNTTKSFEDLELTESSETVVTFQVAPRLKTVSFSLTANVDNVSKNQPETLVSNQSFNLNQIDATDEIQDVHLVPHKDGYSLEVLGKTGEARPKQSVRLKLKPVGFKHDVSVDLQSDNNGYVQLGPLANIDWIEATAISGSKRRWSIASSRQTHYRTLHATVDKQLQLAAPEGVTESSRKTVGLFEIRRGQFVADHFDAIKYEHGVYKISGLKRGDYQLRLKPTSTTVNIRITEGTSVENIYLGEFRNLESRGGNPVHIEKIATDKDKITLQLKNENDYTRVHVIASRFAPRFGSYRVLNPIRDIEPWTYKPSIRRSVYMSGRKIGDEYQYILDRKYATKYPGNMLQRPSLLLDPWAVRETQNNVERLAEGADFGGVGNAPDESAARAKTDARNASGLSDFSNLDFLADRSVLFANLVPDENGRLEITRTELSGHQHVRFVVVDAFTTAERSVNLELENRKIRDLRLTTGMDPDKNFSQTKQTDVLSTGDQFTIDDILSAKFQYYDDLGDIFTLFNTLSGNAELRKFQFILDWPDQSAEKKQELYSEHACHELNFFLMKKDPEFFRSVILKHLANKRDKTFMDRWFLRENVEEFVDPWKYRQLNVVERILLGQRMEERRSDISRNVDEMYLLRPTPRAVIDVLFDTSMISGDFSRFDAEKAGKRLNDQRNNLPELARYKNNKGGQDPTGRVLLGGIARDGAKSDDLKPGGGGGGGFGGRPATNQPGYFAQDKQITKEQLGQELSDGPASSKSSARAQVRRSLESLSIKADRSGKLAESGKSTRSESRKRLALSGEMEQYAVEVPNTKGFFDLDELSELRETQKGLFRRLPATQEWIENNYWHLTPDKQNSSLVGTNQFWREYVSHKSGPFVSTYFAEAANNFTEMMFAISVMDLPFKGPEHKFDYVDNKMDLSAAGTMIALHQQVRPAPVNRENTTILVSENFFQKNDRYLNKDGVRYDKFVSGKFNAHTLYGGQVVITNPTSTPRAIDLLVQIPKGAVPASGTQETRTTQMSLAAFSTLTLEYHFYFPTAGDFTHFPAHVSSDETVLAIADSVNFQVVDQPVELDKTSWQYVSQNGSEDDVIDYINTNNVLQLNLAKIAFRMKDKSFYNRAMTTLRNRLAYHHTLWSYAIEHNEKLGIQEYLKHAQPIFTNVGFFFESDLLTVNPVERNWYYHREYAPLINARIHQVGAARQILNPAFHQQYHQLMAFLANRKSLSHDDHLVVTYYMLLQDRIEEAIQHFQLVSSQSIPNQVQYDYCSAYLDMYMEKPDQAKSKAQKWAEHPIDHWRKRFQYIIAQVDEAQGGDAKTIDEKDNTQQQTAMAAQAESFDFKIEASKSKVDFQNITSITVNYYEMDVELLFSRNPFAQDDLEGFSMIRPNLTQQFELPKTDPGKTGTYEFDLPAELGNKNVLVEIVGGDQTKSQSYFANSLSVQIIENYGQLRVSESNDDKLLAKTYVKVYSRRSDGSVKFHKDGYTDLRGRFDYVSQSNNPIDDVETYSILILHPEYGAIIRQVDPPKE